MQKGQINQMWGGCFTQKTAASLLELNSSIQVDKRMYKEDILASQVYANGLLKAKVISAEHCEAIIKGLDQVREEWDKNLIMIQEQDEDIHSVNERRLRELIGDAADRLHTGRSRNDQVATDVRLWIHNNGPAIQQRLYRLVETILHVAKREINVIMPGYTHLKRAQPVRFSHFLLSHAWSFKDDEKLLKVILERVAVLPLGSGALAGNPFDIDRRSMAKELGFSDITMNSMNAVGNRDFIAEFLFWCSLCGTHLSRLAEDLIIFSTAEFGFLRVSQEYSTGSSLLPQKRNPDGLELARGSAGQLIGTVTGFLATLKSLPSTYNKDLQVDKKMLFESFDLISQVLDVVNGTITTITVDSKRCFDALEPDQLAAKLAHWLVKRGLPFRQAHHAAGQALAAAETNKVPFNCLKEKDRVSICSLLSGDLSEVWDFEAAVEDNKASGGTARCSVLEQMKALEKWLQQSRSIPHDI